MCIFGLSFLAASFVIYPVAEKSSKVRTSIHSCLHMYVSIVVLFISQAKHIQFVSGVHITSFWLSAYLWDLINSLVPTIVAVILFAAFPIDAYRESLGSVFLLFVSI